MPSTHRLSILLLSLTLLLPGLLLGGGAPAKKHAEEEAAPSPHQILPAWTPPRPAPKITDPEVIEDLSKALAQVQADGRLLFIYYGRPRSTDCRLLGEYIARGLLPLDQKDILVVSLDCDLLEARQQFKKHFPEWSGKLPFVVVANASGQPIAKRTGRANLVEYRSWINTALYQQEMSSLQLAEDEPHVPQHPEG